MAEITQITGQNGAATQPPAPPKKSPEKKKKRKKRIKTILILVVILAVIVAVVLLLRQYVFTEKEPEGEILTDTAMISSIQSMVEGSGTTKAKDSATITLGMAGTVKDVFVAEGDTVQAGDPLYTIDSTAATEAVKDARETLNERNKELNALNKEIAEALANQKVTAPFNGKLMDVATFHVGDDITSGTKVATVVNDTKLKLSLYYSYAYENDVWPGQAVQVSLPATMSTLTGTVEAVNKVDYITPEGTACFEVVVFLDNPGTLTAGMSATATMTGADGTLVYPYASGTLEYYDTRELTAKTDGTVTAVNLLDYARVSAGQSVLELEIDDPTTDLADKQDQVKEAQDDLDKAQEDLDKFNAVAPIGGTVISCALTPGEEVDSGLAAITIADISTITVDLSIDERNITYLQNGMMINLTDWNGNTYMGTIQSMSMEGKYENGVSTFSAVAVVDNPDGMLRVGMGVNYQFVASESSDCLVIPIQCIKYISDEDGNTSTVVYLKADTPPDNAITLSDDAAEDCPDGFYAVPVEVGISDTTNVEILSGLNEGDVVFTNRMTDQSDSFQY